MYLLIIKDRAVLVFAATEKIGRRTNAWMDILLTIAGRGPATSLTAVQGFKLVANYVLVVYCIEERNTYILGRLNLRDRVPWSAEKAMDNS